MNQVSKTVVAHGKKWQRINKPKAWSPLNPKEELIGQYVGRVSANGRYGTYEKVLIQTGEGADQRVLTLSGTCILNLFNGLVVDPNKDVRVVFLGRVPTGNEGHIYKDYELYTEK